MWDLEQSENYTLNISDLAGEIRSTDAFVSLAYDDEQGLLAAGTRNGMVAFWSNKALDFPGVEGVDKWSFQPPACELASIPVTSMEWGGRGRSRSLVARNAEGISILTEQVKGPPTTPPTVPPCSCLPEGSALVYTPHRLPCDVPWACR